MTGIEVIENRIEARQIVDFMRFESAINQRIIKSIYNLDGCGEAGVTDVARRFKISTKHVVLIHNRMIRLMRKAVQGATQ